MKRPRTAAAATTGAGAVHEQPPPTEGFTPLALRLHASSTAVSFVFLKHHRPAQESGSEAPPPGALYVTGLPLALDSEPALAMLFGVFGDVTQVALHPSKRSAAIVFAEPTDVDATIEHARAGRLVECPLPLPEGPIGIKALVATHKAGRPGNQQLQQQLDEWMEAHEAAAAAAEAARQQAMGEDGWTVVVRSKGRKRAREADGVSTVSGGIAAAAAAAAAAASEAKTAKAPAGFYRFQQRDKRRSELLELRQKFEEGRKRLATLKAARHFKPG